MGTMFLMYTVKGLGHICDFTPEFWCVCVCGDRELLSSWGCAARISTSHLWYSVLVGLHYRFVDMFCEVNDVGDVCCLFSDVCVLQDVHKTMVCHIGSGMVFVVSCMSVGGLCVPTLFKMPGRYKQYQISNMGPSDLKTNTFTNCSPPCLVDYSITNKSIHKNNIFRSELKYFLLTVVYHPS